MEKIKDLDFFEKSFKFIYKNNYFHIINYERIINFESNKIIIKFNDKMLTIIGENLIIKELLSSELLIKGEIKKIEIGD